MELPFNLIAKNFPINWDISAMLSKFKGEMVYSEDSSIRHQPISDPTGALHWQTFPGNISFSRNFYANFPNECNQLIDQILKLQNTLRRIESNNHNYLIKSFLNHSVNKHGINLIRIFPGMNVVPHFDITRQISMNIGLLNSETATTHIAFDSTVIDFYSNKTVSYTMNDNEVYLVLVKNAHSVTSNVLPNSDKIRYLITYNINVSE